MNTYYYIDTIPSPPVPVTTGEGANPYQRIANSFEQANENLPAGRAYVPPGPRLPYDADTQTLKRAENPTLTEWPFVVVDMSQEWIDETANSKKVQSVTRDELISALLVIGETPITDDDIRALLQGQVDLAQAALDGATTDEEIAAAEMNLKKAILSLARFNNATDFSRNHPTVQGLAAVLGLNVDDVFNLAIKFRDPLYDHFADA